jgi:hypothetical protein
MRPAEHPTIRAQRRAQAMHAERAVEIVLQVVGARPDQHRRHGCVDAIARAATDDVRAIGGFRRVTDDAEIPGILERERTGRRR